MRKTTASLEIKIPLESGREDLYGWCLQLSYSDQQLSRSERETLVRIADRLGIPEPRAGEIQKEAQFGRLETRRPEDRQGADRWRECLSELALADGRLDVRETELLDSLMTRGC